jgi:hypothetical protein
LLDEHRFTLLDEVLYPSGVADADYDSSANSQ